MIALITGAGQGIGLAIAQATAADELILVARSRPALEQAAGGLRERGCIVHVVPTDLAAAEQIEALAAWVESHVGGLDLLIHAAGAYRHGVWSPDLPDADALMAVNYAAPVRLTTRLLPLLKQRRGQIVFINSTQGLQAGRAVGAYAASKFALRAFADSLRVEVNADGIRVISIFAGSTATPLQERLHAETGRPWHPERLMQPNDVAAMVTAAVRLPRTAEVTDLTMRPMQPPPNS